MKFIADLHIHSRFSRATSREMTLENIWFWANLKGLKVIGTGDFTHPEWFREISKKLSYEGNGLFSLKKEFQKPLPSSILRGEIFFILSTELSFIYSKGGKIKRIHILVLLPDLSSVERLIKQLSRLGNLSSDGRPGFGVDVREIIKMGLDISEDAIFIPAHVWTPHFSLFGSESGFDSIEECFEEESKYIRSIETGLSSDPKMNWRLSRLDSVTLVSNSDAHSPQRIGREANIFDTELSFSAIKKAIETKKGFLATIEFFPEEGKYHFDGHRSCGVLLSPKESMKYRYLCPKCGRKVTIGVMHRVETLADRKEGEKPEGALPFYSLVPLSEILSEVLQVSPSSAKVEEEYFRLIEKYGNEFSILLDLDESSLNDKRLPLFKEAIKRVREGKLNIRPGYDGEYGKISIFGEGETPEIKGQQSLF